MFRITSLVSLLMLTLHLNAQVEDATNSYNAGVGANNAGNLQEAIDNFTQCISIVDALEEENEDATKMAETSKARIPVLCLQIATESASTGTIDESISNFEKAIEAAEKYGDADSKAKALNAIPQLYYKKATGKYKAAKLDEAIVAIDNAIKYDDTYAKAYYLKAVVYKKMDDDDKFYAAAKLAIEKAGDDAKVKKGTIKLASGHFLKKGNKAKNAAKYDEALNYINKSIEFKDNDVIAYQLLQQIYSAQKKWDASIEAGKKALSLETDAEKKAGIYYELGTAYEGKGDTGNACSAYKSAAVGKYKESAKYKIEQSLKCQ